MTQDRQLRRHPAHPSPVRRHNEPVIVLVTVCTYPRAKILANASTVQALRTAWSVSDHWTVGTYVVMPDHVHLFCAPGRWDCAPVKNWARYWKRRVADEIPALERIFQYDCWDTQMRSQSHYLRKLDYVRANPVRKDLCTLAEDWPFSGTATPLHWVL
ncbi:MAG: hypothetical protein HN742_20355 [Lentisphaerae bacterium]|nr:hypothetical protein [Lentisphaerota bacterium]MBT7061154.1 hypothetical protein [Lentisphaerota bacterium]MBT7844244.1 hypothetical protein [Lentisphaerota bacterium]